MMCPVYNTASLVPLVLAKERNPVTSFEAVYARREINVVSNQQCLAAPDPDNESLVPAAVVVIRKLPYHDATATDLVSASLFGNRAGERCIGAPDI